MHRIFFFVLCVLFRFETWYFCVMPRFTVWCFCVMPCLQYVMLFNLKLYLISFRTTRNN
eukprot:UN01056